MFPRFASITSIVAGFLVMVTTVLLGLFFVLLYFSDLRVQIEHIRMDTAVNADQTAAALSLPVWNLDTEQINKILDSVAADPSVYAIVLSRGNGSGRPTNRIQGRVRDSQWHVVQTEQDIAGTGMLMEQRHVFAANGEDIGTIKIYATTRFAEQMLWRNLELQACFILILDVAVVVSLYGMLWYVILRPLRNLERFALAVQIGGSSRTMGGGSGGHEIHRVQRSIERMVAELNGHARTLEANEVVLRRQIAFDEEITRILGEFSSTSGTALEVQIQNALEKIGSFVNAEYGFIVSVSQDRESYSVTHEWRTSAAPTLSGKYQNVRWSEKWQETEIAAGRSVRLTCLDDIPPEATELRSTWLAEGRKSQLMVPITGRGGMLHSCIGLMCFNNEIEWRDEDDRQVRLVGQAIGNALQRKAADDQIRQLNVELEQRVRERTVELEAANRELEAFSYSVSHDLRAPLRAIAGFSQILQEDHADSLPGDARRCLKVIHENTVQMGRLIDDLLAFSRLIRRPLRKERVSIGQVFENVVAELRSTEPADRNIVVQIDSLPACLADPALLRSVVANLVSNALKYTRKRKDAMISIGYSPAVTNGAAYFIRDNGAGFDMRHVGKLFGVFQRLHKAEDFEGTGVGLAIVQRIIDRHGGRVWAEARLDEGATFFFTMGSEVA